MEDQMYQHTTVKIEQADNGFVCTVCYAGGDEKKTIYKKLEQIAKKLPAIFSIAKAEAPEETTESLEGMKANLKKEEE